LARVFGKAMAMRRVRWLYLRALGGVALVATGSFWAQLQGLIGADGIWPAARLVGQLKASPDFLYFDYPTLAWISGSDAFLHFLAGGSVLLSVLLIIGVAPRLVLGLLWLFWMSLVHVGGPFLNFQWDVLLIEASFFSIPFAPPGWFPRLRDEAEPAPWSVFLLQWLAFKLTFSSGVVKLASGDPSWRDLTALSYHYWTQPLATWSSELASLLPMGVHQAMCFVMFVLELPVAALALGPPKLRQIAAWGMLTLQAGLAAAGNYSYFNLLAIVLCIPLIDDAALRMLAPKWKPAELPERPHVSSRGAEIGEGNDGREAAAEPNYEIAGRTFAAAVAVLGLMVFFRIGAPVLDRLQPFNTLNGYGAFAWMSKTRPEIILEGSNDGVAWTPWEFKYKPGRLDVRPGFIAPWQPRLDWQMWFAALGPCERSQWVLALQQQLLKGSSPVRALMGEDPFGGAPPKFLRTTLWQYRFAPWSEKGVWWAREDPRPFCPPLTLGPDGRLTAAVIGVSP
jgi:hypothetical protein